MKPEPDASTEEKAKKTVGGPTVSALDPCLLANPVVVIATNGPDGRPQVSAVWFLVEEGKLSMSVTTSTQKYRNLIADSGCTLLLAHPDTPNYYAEIRGNITINPDDDYRFADRLGARYHTDMRTFDQSHHRRAKLTMVPAKINVIDVRS